MKFRLGLFITVSVLAASSCLKEEAVETIQTAEPLADVKRCEALVPGQVIIQFDTKTVEIVEKNLAQGKITKSGLQDLDRVFENLKVSSVERLYPDAGEFEERHREAGLHTWYLVHYDESAVVSTKADAQLLDNVNGIVYTEPVRRVKSTAHISGFNDTRIDQQWHYYNPGGRNNWKAGADINVVPVWRDYTAGTSNVIVSIVDGGIDLEHEDLKGVCMPGGVNGSRNFKTKSYTITPHGHGTHVAGTVGAINNNGKGVAGVAGGRDGNGGVTLMSCQVFDDNDEYGSGFYEAMVWGADHGAVISQNSWGNVYQTAQDAAHGSVGAMKGAIDYFIKYAGVDKKTGEQTGPMKGGVVFFAAGNDGWPDGWPAEYDGDGLCIAVGSFSSLGTRAYYSNYGDWVDIAAPGGDARLGPQVISTTPNNTYSAYQGTSMACPHVSGVAALIVSEFGGPGFTNRMLVERLLGGADKDFIPSSYNIGPMLDAYGAFVYGNQNPPAKVASYEAVGTGGNVNFKWKVTADSEGKPAYGYTVFATKNKSDFTNFNPRKLPEGMLSNSFGVGDLKEGDEMTGYINGLGFTTTYHVAIVGYDYGRAFSELSEVKTVTTTANQAPVVEPQYTGDWKIKASQQVTIPIRIYDPDNHAIKVEFKTECPTAKSVKVSENLYNLIIDAVPLDAGKYKVQYLVTDSYGLLGAKTINFEVLPNHAPSKIKDLENVLFVRIGETKEIDITEYIFDEDGDEITFEAEHTNPKVLHVNQIGSTLSLTSLAYGLDNVVLHAKDVKGLEGTFTFKVNVWNPSSDADIYPTKVSDYLKVSGGPEADTEIDIYSSTGKLVISQKTKSSAFEPAVVDVRNLAPGIYSVKVLINKKQTVRNIVKY